MGTDHQDQVRAGNLIGQNPDEIDHRLVPRVSQQRQRSTAVAEVNDTFIVSVHIFTSNQVNCNSRPRLSRSLALGKRFK